MCCAPGFDLYLITDRHQLPPGVSLSVAVEQALRGGVRAVQLRERDLSAAALYPLAKELRVLTRGFGARLFVNDRIDVALAVGADGVHLGGHSLPPAVVRERFGDALGIGVSTHNLDEVERAAEGGADFVTFGPVYPTPSKAQYGTPVGLTALQEVCRRGGVPVFGLGGIDACRQSAVVAAGAVGVALISAVLGADDPRQAAEKFCSPTSKLRGGGGCR